jgi:hypothetical protein
MPGTVSDNLLGEIAPDPRLKGSFRASIPFEGRQIELSIQPDGVELDKCLAVARELVTFLKALEAKARVIAASELLTSYNSNWREFQRVLADGEVQDVTNPLLSADELAQRLQLTGIGVTGRSIVDFWFSDDGRFAGHSVFVTSFDATALGDTSVALFG